MSIVINENDRHVSITASASQTVFAYDFPVFDDDELVVYQTLAADGTTSTLTKTTHYTVSGVGAEGGGNVTLVTGAAENDIITIDGAHPDERATNFSDDGDFRSETVNAQLDRIVMMAQQLRRDVDRSLHMSAYDVGAASGMTLPAKADRASKFLSFDADGDATATALADTVVTLATANAVHGTNAAGTGAEEKTGFTATAAGALAAVSLTLSGALVAAAITVGSLDMDGGELILDADADTSFHASTDDQIDVKVGGSDRFLFHTLGLFAADAAGPGVMNEAATSTNPTILPNKVDADTGVGWVSADIGALIAGGSEIARWLASTVTLTVPLLAPAGTNVAPGVAVGEADTGIYRVADGTLGLTADGNDGTAGSGIWFSIDATLEWNMSSGALTAGEANGPALANEAASASNPTLIPNRADMGTGVGANASANELYFLISGAEKFRAHGAGITFWDDVRVPDGSASDPSIQFNSDPNSGIAWINSDNWGLVAGGSYNLYVQSGQTFANKDLYGLDAAGPGFLNEAASNSNPTLVPHRDQLAYGIGGNSGEVSIIGNGSEVVTVGANTLGFFGAGPLTQRSGWTAFSNVTTTRTLDADATTVAEVADVLGTLVSDLSAIGLIAA